MGFGTGLNVLAAWDSWRRTAPAGARLHIVSVEGFPLSVEDLAEAHAAFPEFAALSAELRRAYPRRVPGFHRLRLDGGRVTLTLLFGPVLSMLASLEASVDAWFLDGFAPSRNPEMWSDAVFREIARLCAPGARLATFSAAGAVRRGLAAAGFAMEKRPGFGGKRECLAGRYEGGEAPPQAEPWFATPPPVMPGARVAVIGGGIAGRAAARCLADEGFRPVLFDAGAGDVQPNRVLVSPRLADPNDPYGRFMAQAFLHADRCGGLPPATGALHLPSERESARLCDFADRLGWGDDLVRPVDAAAASSLAGLPVTRGGVWYPMGRFAAPSDVAVVEMRREQVTGLTPDGAGWAVRTAAGPEAYDAVVLAAGPWSAGLVPGGLIGLRGNRGQLCHMPPVAGSARLRLPVSFGGHVTPLTGIGDGVGHVLGSSYERWDMTAQDADWRGLRQGDLDYALDGVAAVLPDWAEAWRGAPLQGWAGLRATTADHVPMVGPLADRAAYDTAYRDLHHGRRGALPSAPYLNNAFILAGLGSRGYQTAFLAAELLAATLSGAPLPVDSDVARALHPARMQVRALRRPPSQRDER